MADILIRNVPLELASALRARAKRNGRSLQAETIAALRDGLMPSGAAFSAIVGAYHANAPESFDVAAALAALDEDRSR